MENREKKRGVYFQSIAARFYELRGAPFFLSSKELDLIATWEKMEIPLHVVLEGMKSAFESYRKVPGRKNKIFSLGFCNPQILRAYEQHKDRQVGDKKSFGEREKKKKQSITEIKKFLNRIPSEVEYLKEAYSRAQRILARSSFEEEELEQIEEEIETLLLRNSLGEERKKIEKRVLEEYEFQEADFERIIKIKLIKQLREKYRLPHISPFYY